MKKGRGFKSYLDPRKAITAVTSALIGTFIISSIETISPTQSKLWIYASATILSVFLWILFLRITYKKEEKTNRRIKAAVRKFDLQVYETLVELLAQPEIKNWISEKQAKKIERNETKHGVWIMSGDLTPDVGNFEEQVLENLEEGKTYHYITSPGKKGADSYESLLNSAENSAQQAITENRLEGRVIQEVPGIIQLALFDIDYRKNKFARGFFLFPGAPTDSAVIEILNKKRVRELGRTFKDIWKNLRTIKF